jgi:hypothetical protein
MKINCTAISATFLAAMMLGPVQLAAQNGDPIVEAFERGRTSGVTPSTRGEKMICAGNWAGWAGLMSDPPPDEDLVNLPRELRPEGVFGISNSWDAHLLSEGVKQADIDKATDKALDEMVAAFGDDDPADSLRYFETLGTCLPRWHESEQ